MEVTAITRNARMSAFKGRPLARECQGLPATAALQVVEFSPKKAAGILKKTILSAMANAKNNHHPPVLADGARLGASDRPSSLPL